MKDLDPAPLQTLLTVDNGASTSIEPNPAPLPAVDADLRYTPLARLGQGGMAEVWRVHDGLLGRDLAMKIIGRRLSDQEDNRLRFVAEANLGARLQHPNLVPVHDRGVLPDGRLYFTMPEVRGRTLEALIAELHRVSVAGAWQTTGDGISLRGLLAALTTTCQAVAYAHSQGVLHRDLKPSNIMIGPFGELQVMDWGVATTTAAGEAAARRGDDAITGTPAYMAPEQAMGLEQGPPVDVYAIGGMLYALLAGRPALAGGMEAIHALRQGPPPPLQRRLRPDHPPLPPELVALTEAAMARDPDLRPSASALAEALTAWLDGATRRDRARALVAQAAPLAEQVIQRRAAVHALRAEATRLLGALGPRAPADQKAPGWALEERASALEIEATLAETRWLEALRVALEHDPELPEAHAALADHHQARMAGAEARRDRAAAAHHEVLLRVHDRGRHQDWLSNRGRVAVWTEPAGARATLWRVVSVQRRLRLVDPEDLGPTPLIDRSINAGSWVLRLEAPGHLAVDLPVLVPRGGAWDGIRPGDTEPRPLRLPRPGELGPEDHLVPAGWALLGGDPDAMDPLPLARWWIDGLVVRRHPVTLGEHLAFLQALVDAGRDEEARRYEPAEQAITQAGAHPHVHLGPDRRYVLGQDGRGTPLTPDLPVTFVDHATARAYAAWEARRTGQPWRLLHDLEREKLARGVDGRHFPWGDTFDPTWACTLASHEGSPARAPISAWAEDVGPYGVRGLAGNVRDWCCNAYRREGEGDGGLLQVEAQGPVEGYCMVRGGSYFGSAPSSRAASRVAAKPHERLGAVGFRLGRPW